METKKTLTLMQEITGYHRDFVAIAGFSVIYKRNALAG